MTILTVACMNHLSGKLINQDVITGDQCVPINDVPLYIIYINILRFVYIQI